MHCKARSIAEPAASSEVKPELARSISRSAQSWEVSWPVPLAVGKVLWGTIDRSIHTTILITSARVRVCLCCAIALCLSASVPRTAIMLLLTSCVACASARCALDYPPCCASVRCYGGQSRGCIWYFDIPSPNTTVFGILWPPSIAHWGTLVPPYTLFVQLDAFTGN
jgi:hypothetical protein